MLTTTRTVGPYTIERKLGTGGIAESFLGSPTAGDGPQVVIRRVLPFVCADPQRLAATEARVRDLIAIRHPFLVPVVDWLSLGRERFIVEEHVPGETLTGLLEARRQLGKPLPPNVFLNLATQICNGLEALHGRPGTASGGPQVLHLGLRPDAILVTPEGKVVLGSYGLVRSPTLLPHGGVTAPSPGQLRYLAPEQTLSDATLSAASDIFSLGSILFELATNRVLFDAGSNLRTIHAVRRADVSSQLQTVRERIPGLDRVLTRALAQNPRFRYNRAFVLREDLRGLMASYSFSTVNEDTRAVLDSARTTRRLEPAPAAPSPEPQERLLAEAPQPHLSAGQAETLHTHKGIEEGLFEDTRHSGGPPPLVTDEQPVHQRPNVDAQFATPEPTPAAPPSKFEPTIPDLSVDPATPSEDETPLFEDDILADPGFAPHAEFDDSDDEVPWDPPKSARVSTPEELPEAPTALPPQPALLSPTPAAAGGTAAFQRSASATSSAPLAPPPPSGALPDTPTLPPAPHKPAPAPVLDSSGRPVAPNDTAFIPAPPARLAPPSADTPNEPPPLLRPPMPPAPAAPASAEDTAFFAAPLPPASAPPPAELPNLRPPPPLPPAPASAPAPPAPSDVPQLPRELSEVPQPPLAFATPPSAPANVPLPAATPPPPPVQAPPPPSTTAQPRPAIAPDAVPSPTALEAAAALPAPPALMAPPSPPARPAPPPPATEARPAPVAPPAPVVEPLRSTAPPPPEPAERSSKTILAVGVAAAAIALVFCAGLGSYVVQQGDAPGPGVATAIDEPAEAAAAVVEQKPPAKSPEFAAEDTGQAAVAQNTPSPKARPQKSTSSRSSRASRSEPRSAPPARRARPPRIPTPALPTAPRAAAPSAPEPGLEDARDDVSVDLDRAARTASAGSLDPSTRRSLEAKAIDDPDYTQARTILAVDAAQRGDAASAERYLEQTMSLPENRYNPVLLSQLALHQVNRQRYATALSNANRAEQHWARLPSNVMYERKAIIYEVQAAATQGLLYEAESDQQQRELVNDALRRWTRFREHATSGSSIDQIARADRQIEKLTSIRARLE